MGTSNAYGGPGGGTPLVPTWLGSGNAEPASPPAGPQPDSGNPDSGTPETNPAQPERPPIQTPPNTGRFTTARNNLSRFASSGGNNRSNLGRAVSKYVSSASGGAKQASMRMGSSRGSGARLLNFLSDVRARGVDKALQKLNLASLAGKPIDEVFLGLADYVCPDGGTVDEGIARDAFFETIAELAANGITDLNSLTAEQMQTVFELYATHAIETRLCNDIGAKTIFLPGSVREATQVQDQIRDFIQRSVSDALTAGKDALQNLTADRVLGFVSNVYEQAFNILQALGEAETA